jgi:diacylglycerol kinase family enzyme
VDVVEVDAGMRVRARRQARRRARTGAHLPHPQIAVHSTGEWRGEFARPLGLWIDGERRGDVRVLEVTVVPDALIVFA